MNVQDEFAKFDEESVERMCVMAGNSVEVSGWSNGVS